MKLWTQRARIKAWLNALTEAPKLLWEEKDEFSLAKRAELAKQLDPETCTAEEVANLSGYPIEDSTACSECGKSTKEAVVFGNDPVCQDCLEKALALISEPPDCNDDSCRWKR